MAGKVQSILKTAVKKLLAAWGYEIAKLANTRRVPTASTAHTMEGALQGLAARNHSFQTIIDVGASNGSWSSLALSRLPARRCLLIEAQPVHEPALIAFCQQHSQAEYVLAAAGSHCGDVFFDTADPFGGQASPTASDSHRLKVPMTTIDSEVAERRLSGPFLIKLDTHGFEIPILEGARKTLEETAAMVIECYNFRIAPECLLFFELCAYLRDSSFRCIDLVEPLYRPYDQSLWQMDLVFVKDDRPEFLYPEYE